MALEGVSVLTYASRADHWSLVKTLVQWAALRRGGFRSRRALALGYSSRPPSEWQAEETRLVVWALSEPSGTVAKTFADSDLAPPVEWLEVFLNSDELTNGASSWPCRRSFTMVRLASSRLPWLGELRPL